jgi:hypothetical protein
VKRHELIIAQLGEEGSEIAQMASKSLRFGLDEWYHKEEATNRKRLTDEIWDLLGVYYILQDEGILEPLDVDKLNAHVSAKKKKIEKYLNVSRELGILDAEEAAA